MRPLSTVIQEQQNSPCGAFGGSPLVGHTLRVCMVVVLLVATNLFAAARPDEAVAAFEDANRLYEQGKYDEAIAAYSQVTSTGVASPALFFNLGNAYFRSGRIGLAILNYHKALQLSPRDPDVRANLQFVRAAALGAAPPPPPYWQRVVSRLTLNEWALLAGAALWVFAGIQAVRQLLAFTFLERRLLRIAPAVFLAISITGLGLAWHLSTRPRAVVIKPDAVLHHGPLDESPSLQTLQDGQELTVLDRKDDWLQVAGAQRGVGWIRNSQVALLP